MSLRDEIGYAAGKSTALGLRLLRRSGTALPGYVAERISRDPLKAALRRRTYDLRVIVSGTNGKTTTTHLVAKLLETAGYSVVSNGAGSNLYRGVTTVALKRPSPGPAALVLEVDEASLPRVVEAVRPTHVVLLNIFRDQLDRYGEVSSTQAHIVKALKGSSASAILCGDDPWVAMLPELCGLDNTTYFGLELTDLKALPHDQAADYPLSPKTHQPMEYSQRYLSHLGRYMAADKSWKRPEIDVAVTQYKHTKSRVKIGYTLRKKQHMLISSLTGIYNAYNLVAVAALAARLELDQDLFAGVVAAAQPAFGRQERVVYDGSEYQFFLIKNPTGFNQVIQNAFASATDKRPTLIAINDNFADGRDVSWLWDSALEDLKTGGPIVVSGVRAYDMALRLEYAGIDCEVELDLVAALRKVSAKGDQARILPTYTALLEIRQLLNLKLEAAV